MADKKPDDNPEISRENTLKQLTAPLTDAFNAERITPKYLAKKLKAELNAKENEVFVPGDKSLLIILKALKDAGVDFKNTKKLMSALLLYSKPGIAWGVRQKARQDAHTLLGHYPEESVNVGSKGPITFNVEFTKKGGNGNGGNGGK